jgi:hypothetical protein
MLSACSKCNSTTSDSRSIRERKTLHPFNRCTIEGRSRPKGSRGLVAQLGFWPVSDSISLISVVHLSSSPRVKFVSKSMIRTGRSNGCRAWGADLARKRLRRGMEFRSGSVVQCMKAYVMFVLESQKAARLQNGTWWNSVLKTYAMSVRLDFVLNVDYVPLFKVSYLQKCSASSSISSGRDCAKKQWHLAINCANLFGNRNDSTIFMKSDRDQKTVLSLQSILGSMHEYLMKK